MKCILIFLSQSSEINLMFFSFIQYFGTYNTCNKAEVDDVPGLGENFLKFHQKVDMVEFPCGTIQETWEQQDGRIKYGDELSKSIQIVQRTKVT